MLSCSGDYSSSGDQLFTKVPSSHTGITFRNDIQENDSLNIIIREYIYNGAGVAVGDINNDGLPDLYFAGNQESSRLYLNKGNLKFEDITEQAGLTTDLWCTGAVILDINGDGYQDIFVGQSSIADMHPSRNLLYINNGDSTFIEVGEQAGVAQTNDVTQSAFLDYDKDGDLDLFVMTSHYDKFNPNAARPRRIQGEAPNTDLLFRNDGISDDGNYPVFTDVSKEAGIQYEGYGLGVVVNDFNKDSWPDIYVSNDYISNDVLYVNNGDGTFTNKIASWLRHQAESSMGVDAADINNDGWADILAVDMMAPEHKHQMLMTGDNDYDKFTRLDRMGYEPQFLRNMLQVHQGLNPDREPYFSEVGQYVNIYKTGWSWSALFADYDNDGLKDIFISNGFPKDLTNLDLVEYRTRMLNDPDTDMRSFILNTRDYVNKLEDLEEENYLFKNEGQLSFSDRSNDWGMEFNGTTHGAVYVDLDQDGDLDLVTNNLNEEAILYKNRLNNSDIDSVAHHYLKINLEGSGQNRDGVGSKIWLYENGNMQYLEHNPSRGYMSAMNHELFFGLSQTTLVDSLKIRWPSEKEELLREVESNQTITLREEDASPVEVSNEPEKNYLFSERGDQFGIDFNHHELYYNDFTYVPLMPHKFSRLGPGLAVADINGDKLEDFIVGGAYRQSGKIFIQKMDGTFQSKNVTDTEKREEDMGVLLFDYDGDEDQDLYIVSGSSEYGLTSKYYQDRLYINDGNGNFELSESVLPETNSSGSVVAAADYDRDGDLDLFRGGRIGLIQYPIPVRSYLFENDGEQFKDVTASSKGLENIGLVSDALWTDVNNDEWKDLIIVGEWMPITIYENESGNLKNKITLPYVGWWNSITAGDFDNDGDTDYVVGNLGLNTQYRGTDQEPLSIVYGDFNNDSYTDAIINVYKEDRNGESISYPMPPRDELIEQVLGFQQAYPDYTSYATTTTEEFLTYLREGDYRINKANEMRSIYFENKGDFEFEAHPLPYKAQMGPLFGMHAKDVNGDNNLDLVLTGNNYSTEIMVGQHDALNGLILLGDGQGNFNPPLQSATGLYVPGDAKGLANLQQQDGRSLILAARNDTTLLAFESTGESCIKAVFQPNARDTHAIIHYVGGQQRKIEFYYGDGYLSHSSRRVPIGDDVEHLEVYNVEGEARTVTFEQLSTRQND
jgi:hypothetical protein